ncbi:MAG: xanthine dehydrogenase family protein [Desulfarculus sp.]|nr:xanthine dehydrogenase family protein [Desulfarculus sp.]
MTWPRPHLQLGLPPRPDALDKASGREKYACDFYPPGLLWAGVKRAGVPHARLRGLNLAAARALPGVTAVLAAADVPGVNRQGVVQKDQPVLVDDKVRYSGDALALVVASDQATLARALALIETDLEPLAPVLDPEEALLPGAPLVHPERPQGNLLLEGRVTTGQGAAALEGCAVVVEASFDLPRQEHAYLETENGWAQMGQDGRLTMVASTQTPFRDRLEVAEVLGLEPGRLRMVAPYCGGAFGGKDGVTVQSLLGLAALHAGGRPVKMWLSREESILASSKRHPARLRYRLGSDDQGRLQALEARIIYDTGPYDHLGGAVLTLGLEHAAGPYRIPHVDLHGQAVYTNNPIGGAFRGFGVPQVAAAMEQTMDLLATRLGLDPLELRRQNALKRGDVNPVGVTLAGSTGLAQCLEAVAGHRQWKEAPAWRAAAPAGQRRGVGLAAVLHGMGYGPVIPDVANAKVELTGEGVFRVYCGVVDMGQGNAGTFLQLAGLVLGQEAEGLELVLPDTDRTLPSGSSSASRTTYTFANALLPAAQALKERLLARAADALFATPAEMALVPGAVRHRPSGRTLPLAQLAKMLSPEERTATHRYRAPVVPERPSADPALQLHGLPHGVFSYAVHLARVEVDELTGLARVTGYLVAADCGQVLNPQVWEQQMQGGVAQGLGYALMEELPAPAGQPQHTDLATYLIPTALDLPPIECLAVPSWEESGPLGLKGCGEIGIDGPLPAVGNALAQALGRHLPQAPFTPERVLMALQEDGKGAGS